MTNQEMVMRAVARGDAERLQQLLLPRARRNEAEWRESLGPALIEASRGKGEACVSALLKAGASANAKDNRGQSALMWAAFYGDARCVEILIDAGADLEQTHVNGTTRAIHTALRSGNALTLQTLLNAGARVLDPDGSPSARIRQEGILAAHLQTPNPNAAAFSREALALLEQAELREASTPAPKSKLGFL